MIYADVDRNSVWEFFYEERTVCRESRNCVSRWPFWEKRERIHHMVEADTNGDSTLYSMTTTQGETPWE
jgi:hypothetical protein